MKLILSVVLAMTLVAGCATYKTIEPQVNGSPRGINLQTPISVSVHDGRAVPDEAGIETLKTSLLNIYGGAIDFKNYFEPPLNGHINVSIRIVELGSNFGSRIISASNYATAYSTSSASASTPWGPIVASGNTTQNIFSGSFSGEGWWIGTVWVEMEIEDRTYSNPETFTLPLAAEHKESNMWGYKSAAMASESAWNKVSPYISKLFDKIIILQRDRENNSSPSEIEVPKERSL